MTAPHFIADFDAHFMRLQMSIERKAALPQIEHDVIPGYGFSSDWYGPGFGEWDIIWNAIFNGGDHRVGYGEHFRSVAIPILILGSISMHLLRIVFSLSLISQFEPVKSKTLCNPHFGIKSYQRSAMN